MVQILYNGVWNDWKPGELQGHYLIASGIFRDNFNNPPASSLVSHGCLGGWQAVDDGLYAPAPATAGGYQMCTDALFDFSSYTTLHILYDNDQEATINVSDVSNAYVLVFNNRAYGGEGSCTVYLATAKNANNVISGKTATLCSWTSAQSPKATTIKSIWVS